MKRPDTHPFTPGTYRMRDNQIAIVCEAVHPGDFYYGDAHHALGGWSSESWAKTDGTSGIRSHDLVEKVNGLTPRLLR